MSWVTDVLLLFDLQEVVNEFLEILQEAPAISNINAWLEEHNFGSLDRLDPHVLGGGMMMQACVYGGAFNFLTLKETEFMRVIRAQPWRFPNHVQILIKHEEEDRFKLYVIANGEWTSGVP